jgi:hypothetical protein
MLENCQKLIGGSFGFFGLLELIGATLLKIDHGVVTHLIAGAMLTQNPTRKLYSQFLHHVYSPVNS